MAIKRVCPMMTSSEVKMMFKSTRETLGLHKDQPIEIIECDVCREKPGSPDLCGGCLYNRKMASFLDVPFKWMPSEVGYDQTSK